MKVKQVAILGVGLIGGSIGLALRARRAAESVVGWDADALTNAIALERKAVDGFTATANEAVAQADLVVLAAPTESIVPLLASIVQSLPERAVVTDVGSAKARIIAEAEPLLPGRFVGGHPMAGLEESGINSASSKLFEGAAWILTPTDSTDPPALGMVTEVVTAVGARPRICDPEIHDQIVAAISHLPHLLAYGLSEAAGRHVSELWVDLIAGSFRDGSRVALSNPARWAEILMDNRTAAGEALDTFSAWLAQVRSALQADDVAALTQILNDAHQARKRFPR